MSFSSSRPLFQTLVRTFAQDSSEASPGGLTIAQIEEACRRHQVPPSGDIWTVPLTIWTFLVQSLKCCSCVAAVQQAARLLQSLGQTPCSGHTGSYCKQRAKIPVEFLKDLALQAGRPADGQIQPGWRWHGYPVVLADGTTLTAPDTPQNQKTYPQPKSQKPGLGFPMIRLVVLMCFATGVCLDAAIGPYEGPQTGELALFRRLIDRLRPGQLVVADRGYDAYWLLVWLQERQVQVAIRMRGGNRSRTVERCLVPGDHLVVWDRPPRPDWMSVEDYEALPKTVTVREVQVQINEPGFRVRSLTVVTTLLDATKYPASEIATLYYRRWRVEVQLRDVKQTLKLDRLACQSPEMVQREIWCKLWVYNWIRQVMAQAALDKGFSPRAISFAATRTALDADRFALATATVDRSGLIQELWRRVSCHRVGNRPGRVEPRKVKRRSKSFPLLTSPRDQERARLLNSDSGANDATSSPDRNL